MEFDPKEQVVIDLLAKLKNADVGYPQKLMASRRQSYLNQMANIGLGIGIGAGIKNIAKSGKGTAGHLPSSAGTLLETIILAAIVIEASVATFIYRDKISDIFQSSSSGPSVEQVSPPVIESPLPEIVISATPSMVATTSPIPTPTPTISSTALPSIINSNDNEVDEQKVGSPPTPRPKKNNGNHFGQTPRPPRDKKNNNK